MSFIGSCSGLHSAKQHEKAKLNEINMAQNTAQLNKIQQTQSNASKASSSSSSYSIFSTSFFKNWSNPQPNINNAQQIQNNHNNWLNSSNAIISSRFQQQTKHH
mmetsp:Transcript_57611/g.51922  ORF Transcript_57611/g.51922 Transcript_57611/m.51922 type:complete len:104 (-) Transcript_57611:108-419(-)